MQSEDLQPGISARSAGSYTDKWMRRVDNIPGQRDKTGESIVVESMSLFCLRILVFFLPLIVVPVLVHALLVDGTRLSLNCGFKCVYSFTPR
jgi:hypothetical protein